MDPVQSWLDAKEVRRMAESLMAPQPEVDPSVADAGYGENFEGFADAATGNPVQVSAAQAQPEQRASVESSLAMAQQVARESGMLNPASQPSVQQAAEPAPEQENPPTDAVAQVPMAQQLSPAPEIHEPAVQKEPEPVQQPAGPAPEIAQTPSFGRGISSVVETSGSRGPFLERLHRFSATVRQDFAARAMFLIDNDGQVILDEVENPKLIQVARTLANASYTAHRQSAGSAAVGNLHVKIGANATLEVVPIHSRYGLLVLGVIFAAPLGTERVIQLTRLLEQAVEPEN